MILEESVIPVMYRSDSVTFQAVNCSDMEEWYERSGK